MSEEEIPAESVPEPEPGPTPDPPTPSRWYRVEFVAPAGTRTPIEAAGRWWGERAVHVLPELCAQQLAARPHFTILSETAKPAGIDPCLDCGKTAIPTA